jgi:hypothetical protein
VPGTYTVRMTLDGKTMTQNVEVKPDPRDKYSAEDYAAGYAFAQKYNRAYGQIDIALNNMDAIKKSLDKLSASDPKVAAAKTQWQDVFASFTADWHNDEDSIQRSGSLRESLPRTGFGVQLPPTAAQLEYASRFDAAYNEAFAKYDNLVKSLSGMNVDGAKLVSP